MFLNTGNSFFKVKTKIISATYWSSFEKELNGFISDKKVLDIQYKPMTLPLDHTYGTTDEGYKVTSILIDRALVTYVDESSTKEEK